MSEPVYEHSPGEDLDVFETALPDILLHQSGRIQEFRLEATTEGERAARFDEGLAALQWMLSRVEKNGGVSVAIFALLDILQEVVVYGNTGRSPDWLEAQLRELGRGQ